MQQSLRARWKISEAGFSCCKLKSQMLSYIFKLMTSSLKGRDVSYEIRSPRTKCHWCCMKTQTKSFKFTLNKKNSWLVQKLFLKCLNNYIPESLRLRLLKLFFLSFFSPSLLLVALSSPLATPSMPSSPAYSPPLPAGVSPVPPPMMTSASLPLVPSATISTIAPPQSPVPPPAAPAAFSTPMSQFSAPPPPMSSAAGPGLPAPPTGPPISGFSISSTYDITRGHAGRAPQSPLMPSFSAPPVTGNSLFICSSVRWTGWGLSWVAYYSSV